MELLEKELEDMLWDNLNSEEGMKKLENRGLLFPKTGKYFRQLNLQKYGIADIVSFKRMNIEGENVLAVTVIELKRDYINANTFDQAIRYCKGIQHYVRSVRNKKINLIFRVILIGKEIDSDDSFCFLDEIISSERFILVNMTYKLSLEGITFKRETGYHEREFFLGEEE